jgi:hypothetical protein
MEGTTIISYVGVAVLFLALLLVMALYLKTKQEYEEQINEQIAREQDYQKSTNRWLEESNRLNKKINELELRSEKQKPTYAYISLDTGMEIFFSYKHINEAIEEFQSKGKEPFSAYAIYPVASFYPDYINLICSNVKITEEPDNYIDLSKGL